MHRFHPQNFSTKHVYWLSKMNFYCCAPGLRTSPVFIVFLNSLGKDLVSRWNGTIFLFGSLLVYILLLISLHTVGQAVC